MLLLCSSQPTFSYTLVFFARFRRGKRIAAKKGLHAIQTDALIEALCHRIRTVKNEAEAEQVLSELREALREHIRLAKTSLETQAAILFAAETKSDHAISNDKTQT
jgi:hypothetical protein